MSNRNHRPLIIWFSENVLWFAGLGLMLASSGIDGAYMAAWMPSGWQWLGLVLNTVSDLSGMVLTYTFGQLRRNNAKTSKKYKMAFVLLGAEVVAVLYSWFFSWRQLRNALLPLEGTATPWVSMIAAGFVPLLLAFIGWAQSLVVAPAEDNRKPAHTCADYGVTCAAPTAHVAAPAQQVTAPAPQVSASAQPETATCADVAAPAQRRATIADWRRISAQLNGAGAQITTADVAQLCADAGLIAPSDSTLRNWRNYTRTHAQKEEIE